MENRIKDLAHDKAFANITLCEFDIKRVKKELEVGSYTPFITKEQNEGILKRMKRELTIWNYIAKLIETDE